MRAFLLAVLIFVELTGRAAALERVLVNGIAVQTFKNDTETIVVVGDLVVSRREAHFSMYLNGIHEGNGRTYVLVGLGGFGQVCPSLYLAIDLSTTKARVSDDFGTCSDLPQVSVIDGALVVALLEMDGKSRSTFTFKDGKLSDRKSPVSMSQGPERAPGGNLAAFVAGKHPSEVIRQKPVADALKRIMPTNVFDELRNRALTGPGVNFTADSRFAWGHSCIRHNCGGNLAYMVFDHAGGAWSAVETEGVRKFYGNPPPEVRALMK